MSRTFPFSSVNSRRKPPSTGRAASVGDSIKSNERDVQSFGNGIEVTERIVLQRRLSWFVNEQIPRHKRLTSRLNYRRRGGRQSANRIPKFPQAAERKARTAGRWRRRGSSMIIHHHSPDKFVAKKSCSRDRRRSL